MEREVDGCEDMLPIAFFFFQFFGGLKPLALLPNLILFFFISEATIVIWFFFSHFF